MARILTEHFESGFFTEARVLSHNFFPGDDSGIRGSIRDSAIYGTAGDGSRRFLNFNNAGGENYAYLQMFGNYSEVYGEIWFMGFTQPVVGADQIIRFYNNAQELASVRLTPNNKWAPRFGGGLNLPQAEGNLFATWGIWHCLEFHYKIDAVVGEFTGKIDGLAAFSYVGNTVVAGLTSFNIVHMFCQLTNHMDLDGLVINDTTGPAPDNTWPGIILCQSRDANADMVSHNDWPVTGGGSKFPKLTEWQDNQTTYISSTVTGQKQGFTYPPFVVPANAQPIAVIYEDWAEKLTAGRLIQTQKLGATETSAAPKNLATDFAIKQNRQNLDPNGAAWTLANANASSSIVESLIP